MQAALEALATVGSVSVAFTDDGQNACGAGQNFTVTFLSELGTLPTLEATAGNNVDDITVNVRTCLPACACDALILCALAGGVSSRAFLAVDEVSVAVGWHGTVHARIPPVLV